MEKLIKLLNEYEYSRFEDKKLATERGNLQDGFIFEKDFCTDIDKPRDMVMNDTHLISKKFGFIKWLVYKDKIEGSKIREKNPYIIDTLNDYTDLYSYEKLLMLLSIQDRPIDFLVSILK